MACQKILWTAEHRKLNISINGPMVKEAGPMDIVFNLVIT
jgi:hypothetical protein